MPSTSQTRWLPHVLSASTLTLLCALTACDSRTPGERARELHNAGQYEESLEILREALEEDTSQPETLFLYGQALRRTNQPQKAVWALRKASEHPDWMSPANLELAAALMHAADWSGAIEAMNRVLEKHPEHATTALRSIPVPTAERRRAISCKPPLTLPTPPDIPFDQPGHPQDPKVAQNWLPKAPNFVPVNKKT